MTDTTTPAPGAAPAGPQGQAPAPAPQVSGPLPQSSRSFNSTPTSQAVHAPAARSTDPDPDEEDEVLPEREPADDGEVPGPDASRGDGDAPDDGGGDSGEGGGYAPAETGATYTADIAMMTAEAEHTEATVLSHYELLISQAERAGNGPKTVQALRAGLEAARSAAGSAREAITAVQGTNEGVQVAYDASGGEAAKDKAYFHGD